MEQRMDLLYGCGLAIQKIKTPIIKIKNLFGKVTVQLGGIYNIEFYKYLSRSTMSGRCITSIGSDAINGTHIAIWYSATP